MFDYVLNISLNNFPRKVDFEKKYQQLRYYILYNLSHPYPPTQCHSFLIENTEFLKGKIFNR